MKKTRVNKLVILSFVLGFVAWGLVSALPAGAVPIFTAEVPITANAESDDSSDMVRDASGNLHVVYVRAGTIYYIVKSSGAWSSEETVASGSSPAIAVDAIDVPHVAFNSGGGVKYTNRSGGTWMETPETVAGTSVNYVDMDVDGDGKAHIVYSDPCCDGDGYNEIYYTNNVSGSFSGPTLLLDSWFDGGMRFGTYYYYPNIKVDSSGNYHISVSHGVVSTGPGEPDYTYIEYFNSGGSLGAPTVFGWGGSPAAMVAKNGIALDGDGNVHLVYYSGSTMYYGKITGATWTETPAFASGSQASIAVNGSSVYVAYVDGSNRIAYVVDSGSGFSSPGLVGASTSYWNPTIAADASNAHVIFEGSDGTDNELYYAVTGPAISANPNPYDFGAVNVGSSSSPQTFTIHSGGTEDLSITDISLSDTTNFTLDASGCEPLPATLSPGGSCSVSVTFNPTESGVLSAELTIGSSDPANPTLAVSLTGTGAEFTLGVIKSGTGSGTVTSSPGGIDCGDDCSEGYEPDTEVTLTASPDTGSHFTGWTGCDSTNGNECTVTMTENKSVTAEFTLDTHDLSVDKSGTGSAYGTVTSSPAGIDCGSDCSETYDYGTEVTLTPVDSAGATFSGWIGCGSFAKTMDAGPPSNECTATITENMTVTAEFTINTYTLTVEKAGTGSGTVSSSPGGIDCGDDCSEVYDYGTMVVLTAAASAGSSFDSWEGCGLAQGNQCTVVLGGDRSVTASFSHVPADVFVCPTGCDQNSIQAAIDASGPGDTIKVVQGTYYENISVVDSKQFILQGGWNNTFTTKANDPSLTVIDGEVQGLGLGTGPVLTFEAGSGVAIQATVENLTLRNGSQGVGGGVYATVYNSGTLDLTLLKNVIRDNQAYGGGGIFASSSSSGEIQLTAINNLIVNNSANDGAGIYALAQDSSSLTASLINNTITDNSADVGGGVVAYSDTDGNLTVYVWNTILWGNTASSSGDDIYMIGANTTVHTHFSDIGVTVNDGGDPGTYTEDSNMSTDPIFVNPVLGNYRLNPDSPCKDAAAPTQGVPEDDFEGQTRPQGGNYDMGADEYGMTFTKVKVLAFNGGEYLPAGETHTITWGAPAAATKFNLSYSVDNGVTWKSIAKGVTGNHYAWSVPTFNANKKVKVKVVGLNGKSVSVGSDTSDGQFTIGVVRILSPNGGETLYSYDDQTISWEIYGTVAEVAQINFFYTMNGGTTWKLIESLTEPVPEYTWTLPEVAADKNKCKVKIVLKDAAGRTIGSDTSDAYFRILAPAE